ncbi:CBF/Mak21 family-domain-containing protein [Lipomyces arxii]|uniref:CBF/Mak21 family-domain-containing protein n=1 Tax=Lipomyces arxii TaxID=56418 RepID=UPI0034CE3635
MSSTPARSRDRKSTGTLKKGRSPGKKSQSGSSSSLSQRKLPPGKAGKALLIDPQPVWHTADVLSSLPETTDGIALDADQKAKLLVQAAELLETETENYAAASAGSSSQKQFLSEIMNAGTLSDRISALTLLIQESPLHSTRSLTGLLALAKKKNRTAALQAVEALKDLFANGNVLPDRKLVWFTNRPDNALSYLTKVAFDKHVDSETSKIANQHLLLWAFEDWLKQFYFSFVQLLEVLSHDAVVHVRTSSLADIMDLIRDKPEQEVNLLRLGVNKLGDADKQIASKASHLILTLEQAHPAMKRVIVNSISELIFRPNSDYHARYYATITLNQTIVTNKDTELANRLIDIYFTLFERLLAESKHTKDEAMAEKKVKKGRWKDKEKGKGPAKQISQQQRIKHSIEAQEEANMRLISAILTGLNRAFPYSSLDDSIFKSHLEVIYNVTRSGNFNTKIQALMLLYQISSASQIQSDRFYQTLYESLIDPRIILSSKQALYLNLVFKAVKNDINPDRVKAFAKRLVQVAAETQNVGFCAGVIYLLREVEGAAPYLRSLITDAPDNGDSDEENFKDVPEEDDIKLESEEPSSVVAKPSALEYDGKIHNPLRANASASCLWELLPLTQHYHPTITHFATHLMSHTDPGARPDLALHTLTHFLDRFVYKSPKTKTGKTGGAGSIMQPLTGSAAYTSKNVLLLSTKSARQTVPVVNGVDWAQLSTVKSENPDEMFFAKYFVSKGFKPIVKKEKGNIEDQDLDDEEAEDIAEGEIWDAMVKSRNDLGDVEDGGSDSDDEGFAEALAGSDDDEIEFDEDVEGEEGGDDADEDDENDEVAFVESDDEDDEDGRDEDSDGGDTELAAMFEAENEAAREAESEEEVAIKTPKTKKHPKTKSKRKTADADEEESLAKAIETKRRRKIKDLPMFASADDYKDMLSGSDAD